MSISRGLLEEGEDGDKSQRRGKRKREGMNVKQHNILSKPMSRK